MILVIRLPLLRSLSVNNNSTENNAGPENFVMSLRPGGSRKARAEARIRL